MLSRDGDVVVVAVAVQPPGRLAYAADVACKACDFRGDPGRATPADAEGRPPTTNPPVVASNDGERLFITIARHAGLTFTLT
ncbi:hypothetical protein AB870_11090 [Pandoraea faecigallinarum]|uniref:Uncharacterized protein n=1 Tax=Pandoraea faecigallinarum TaxID=656179 RepID=A0A0H3WSD6_9BURK|nr:hypothetical protein [Pandoraea faecigallinarum]AKM30530.1 hypothetical protein AB870_11090 [Pandoraea faecigallinarum]